MTERLRSQTDRSTPSDQPSPELQDEVSLRQDVISLRQEVLELRAQLRDRTLALEDSQTKAFDLERRFAEQTAALRESNDTLVSEIVEHSQAEMALRSARDQLQAIL
ncbi:MAG: hypothetical protein O3A14_10580, partial [Cyanobacteria bacterium]|nr:hypothetical protein [Cyanobacteriota bacterium]